MHTTIYCFSATGNSLAITRQIAGEMEDCDSVSMAAPQQNQRVGGAGERIGFIFPVYYSNLPGLVTTYIKRLDILPGTYCFALATCKVADSGRISLERLEDILRKKGVGLSCAVVLQMPGTGRGSPPSPSPAGLNTGR